MLGDLPVIGAFFKQMNYQQNDKELVIIVTPHLVAPLAKGATLPATPGEQAEQRERPDPNAPIAIVRPDLTGTDVVLLLRGIRHTAAPLLSAEPQAWRRYLELMLDGITTCTGRELPYPPPRRLPCRAAGARGIR